MVERAGEARSPSTNFKTSIYCIAYLDILGSKEKIFNDKNNEYLNTLNMLYEDVETECYPLFSNKEKKEFFIKIFSDNILIAVNLENNSEEKNIKIQKMLNIVANIQNEALDYDYLIRGAITIGEFFHNDIFVYGKGLIEAVNIEENIAIFPRVIVNKEIIQLFPQYIFEDVDGNYFVNNFVFIYNSFKLETLKQVLLELLKNNYKNERIKQKIMWIISYYNSFNNYWKSLAPHSCQFITQEDINNFI